MSVFLNNTGDRIRRFVFLTFILVTAHPLAAQSIFYDFVLDRANSGLNATMSAIVSTDGSLIGNYDSATNPEGTRTKPGILGPFGPTENVAVPASISFQISGNPQTHSTGGFRFEFDEQLTHVALSNYMVDFVGETPPILSGTLQLGFDSFRTRTPDSLYIGADLPFPLGDVVLTSLTATQTTGYAFADLVPLSPGMYSFFLTPTVILSGSVEAIGMAIDIPPTPTPFFLTGTLTVGDAISLVTASSPLDISVNQTPDLILPALPIDLPTLLPPGQTAHLLLNLTLSTIGLNLQGGISLNAHGMMLWPGDCTADHSVALPDFAAWNECITGPATLISPGCACGDTNADQHADVLDFSIIQRSFGNP